MHAKACKNKCTSQKLLLPVWLKQLHFTELKKVEAMFSCALNTQISLERVLDVLLSSKKCLILKSTFSIARKEAEVYGVISGQRR